MAMRTRRNHKPQPKAQVALEAVRVELILAEPPPKDSTFATLRLR